MSILGLLAVTVTMSLSADKRPPVPQRAVTVCLNPGANGSPVFRAQAEASDILGKIGVRLTWKADPRACAGDDLRIVINLSENTPEDYRPNAMAFALPYERRTIVVFYDRVQSARVRPLLGHVLAHEIAHILQGVPVHSATGIMKPRWTARDFAEMCRKPLGFTAQDVQMIQLGLDVRNGLK